MKEKSFTKIVQPAVGQKRFCKKFIPAVAEQKCFSLHMKLSFIKWVKPEVEHEKIMQKNLISVVDGKHWTNKIF